MPPQLRRRLLQGLQQIRRESQQLRRQQPRRLGRQDAVQAPRGHHQHRRAGHRVPQSAAGVQQRRQDGGPAPHAHPCVRQLASQAVAGGGPEHHRQHQIGRRRCDQQHFGGDIRIKYAPDHRHAAACQETQPQHASGHGAGHGEQQQGQPEEPFLAAEGNHRQHHPRRGLHRQQAQKAAPGQKHRHGVSPAQRRRQNVPPPAQPDARQAPGAKQQQVVHQSVEYKHAVHIHRGHGPAPFPVTQTIIGQRAGKTGRKKEAGPMKSAPPPFPFCPVRKTAAAGMARPGPPLCRACSAPVPPDRRTAPVPPWSPVPHSPARPAAESPLPNRCRYH